MASVNKELERKEHSWLSWTGTSQLHHIWHKSNAQSILVEWKNKWLIISLSHYSIKDIPRRFMFFLLPFNPFPLLFFSPRHSVGLPHCLAESLPWRYSYQIFTGCLRQWRRVCQVRTLGASSYLSLCPGLQIAGLVPHCFPFLGCASLETKCFPPTHLFLGLLNLSLDT